MRFFITGHGGWKPNDGWFQTPKNGTVKFFTQNAKCMLNLDVYKLVSGALSVQPSQEVGPYRWCPNMTLSPDDDWEKPITDSSFRGGNLTKGACIVRVKKQVFFAGLVEYLINRHPPQLAGGTYEFWWCCCRQLGMRQSNDTTYDPISNTFVPEGQGIGPLQSDILTGRAEADDTKEDNAVRTSKIGMNVSEWVGPKADGKNYAVVQNGFSFSYSEVELWGSNGANMEFFSDRNHRFGKVVKLNRKK